MVTKNMAVEKIDFVVAKILKTNLHNLSCIIKGTLKDHPAKLRLVLSRFHDMNLNVNAHKSNFCAIEIMHLGCIFTRDGIKPQPKKV